MIVSFTYDAIKDRVLARLRSSDEWKDILYHSVNQRLIDAFAKELSYCQNNGEMFLSESKWNIAYNITSLLAMTDFFSYTPYRKIGATGTLKISTSETFDATYPVQIAIPKYSYFSNGNDVYYTTTEDSVLFPSQEYIEIPVVQGIPKTYDYVASGNIYESIVINNDSIENEYYDLLVNGITWDTIENIRLADDGEDLVYTLKNKIDFSGIVLRAGNDYFGKKFDSGDVIEFKYIETLGSTGDILSTDIITTVESSFQDNNGTDVTLYCTNDDALSGGQDYEEKESIRANAPRFYQVGDRPLGLSDYIVILESYSFITKANAWGEAEYNIDNSNPVGTYIAPEENVIHVVGLTSSNGSITSAQETTIRDDINLTKPPTDIIQFEDTLIVYLIFNTTAYISDRSYSGSSVQQNIINDLESRYSPALSTFGDSLYYSDYICLIDLSEGVNHHTTTLQLYVLKSFNTAYEATISPLIENITTSSVSIYYKLTTASTYTLLATDDGVGGWNWESGYTGSGSIVYSTGEATITVTSGITGTYSNYDIKVVFSIDDNDVTLTQRNQILLYGDNNITTQYME